MPIFLTIYEIFIGNLKREIEGCRAEEVENFSISIFSMGYLKCRKFKDLMFLKIFSENEELLSDESPKHPRGIPE